MAKQIAGRNLKSLCKLRGLRILRFLRKLEVSLALDSVSCCILGDGFCF